MALVAEQAAFLIDFGNLVRFATEQGFVVTAGELHRPVEMQQLYVKTGRSKTMDSWHLKRLAGDLNFFKDGKLIYDVEALRPIGAYWESLHHKNRWGGNFRSFKDVPHFERQV